MTDYRMQEGSLPFPGKEWVDASMNIIRHPGTHTSLVVTRGTIPAGRTFEEELDFQWQQMLAVVQQLKNEPPQRVRLAQAPAVMALETHSQFIRAEQTHYQRQLAAELPGGERMLILALTALRPFSAEEDDYWQQLRETLVLTE